MSSSSSHKQFAHLRIPLDDIVSATDNFSDANLFRSDEFGKEYRGQLLQSGEMIDIVARRLDETHGHGEKEFWMEVSMLSKLEHKNIVSIVGFCDESGEKIVINKRVAHGSLYTFLRDPILTWMQRLKICFGIAHALSYIHYDEGRDFSIIHRDIKSSKILLDEQWEPKLSGFELSMNQAAAERNRPCQLPHGDIRGTVGYIDPAYYNTASVSHKSDLFSLGVVFIEVLSGKSVVIVNEAEKLLFNLAKSHYVEGTLGDMVDPGLQEQMDPKSFKIFSETAYGCLNLEPSERPSIDQIIIELEKALESQEEHENRFAHLQLPLKEIVSATNNFSDANLIRGSALGKAYRGQLLRSEELIDIVAQRFDHEHRDQDAEFWNEIFMLSTLEHKNVISMVGFCIEYGKIIVYKHEAKGSLETFLRDPALTWMRRLQICVGVAHALSYIHYDEKHDFSIIHCDIRSSKILLDDNWEAKLFGFELSLKQTVDQRNDLCFTDVCGTRGYRDPTYNQSGSVTHKSDMYSLGVILFEVLCGKKAVMVDDNNRFLAPFAKSQYEGGRLDGMIDPGLRKQMDPQSFQIYSDIAYQCLKEQRSQRPNIGVVVMELEKALESQWKHESLLIFKTPVEGTTNKNLKGKDLKHLEIPLIDIKMATGDFTRNVIGSGTFGDVYKAELDHFDSKSLLPLEEKNRGECPKKRSTVAIKRIKIREDQQGEEGFLAEIEMLSSCKHPNIVSLLGFCKEDSHMILVYEHATNGSLQAYMGSTSKYLTWVQRIKISTEIAHGLNYLHTKIEDERRIIHRDIKSDNILLGDTFEAKIADFGLSKFRPESQQVNTIYTMTYAGTDFYMDPEYSERGKLSNKIDIYSFGVVLFEILSGRLANDPLYINENSNGIAPVARRRFNDKTIKEIVDPRLWEETHKNSFALTKGPNQYALHAFLEIAHQCVAESQIERPTAEVIVKKLRVALSFQEGNLKYLEIPLGNILSATENFAKSYLICPPYGEGYKAELDHFDSKNFLSLENKSISELPKKRSTVVIKRIIAREDKHGKHGFHAEIEMLTSCRHPNIVSLLGFCEEGRNLILVFEHASNGSVYDYLGNTGNLNNLTWVQRIKICIDIARGLNYLYNKIKDELRMIQIDIKCGNIMLGENWEAKIAGFELSKFHPEDDTYIYSFGVVLFEILSGRFANDPIYTKENSNGIVAIACQRFREGKIKKMVDPRLMKETNQNTLNKGPGEESLDAFSKIAYHCVTNQHPLPEAIVKKLEEALYFQENIKDHLKISLVDIELATQNFSDHNLIGEGGFGQVYKGEVTHAANGRNAWAVKRLDRSSGLQGEQEFKKEIQTLLEYRHENIIGIVGYCFEKGENIIVYEYASRGSLDKHLSNNGLTWMKRLQICIDIASGLEFLHAGGVTQEVLIHRDIKTHNILLNDDWKAKISDFGLSLISPVMNEIGYVSEDVVVVGTVGYCDPLYIELGLLSMESDIYTFGVVLFEILSGRLIRDCINKRPQDIPGLFKRHYKEGKLDEIVFEGIKGQITRESLTTFLAIAYKCLHREREKRPKAVEVLLQLKKALDHQEDYEVWEPKLPNDYTEITQMSNSPEIYSNEKKKDLYERLCKGILLQDGKMLFTLGDNGARNEMISAKTFSYMNHSLHRWLSIPESRFQVVVEMLDILNLKIKIKTRTHLLSPNVVYGVYLVFKFCDPRKHSSKPLYVNLKYRNRSKTSHAYFAKQRDNEWMMIELWRFLNDKEDMVFKFLVESFSRCYCEDSTIYVEGIEFRAITNVKNEEINESKKVQEVLKRNSNTDLLQQLPTNHVQMFNRFEHVDGDEKLFWSREVNGKKHLMLSAKTTLNNYSNAKLFKTISSTQSRFQEVIELLPQQVFRINCIIESEMLSRDTNYACYLVFILSKKCHGLYCPVKVRDLLNWTDKEAEVIYFRSPSPWNLNDTHQAPEQRADGWMEVKVLKFNLNHEFKDDDFHVNLRLNSYEGTMSGLIVCGIEFRPI